MRPKTKMLTVEQWCDIPDNPRQRDTERHARKAIKYLATPSSSHYIVHAAMLPDGTLYKLDGHTRALLWDRGDIPQPTGTLLAVIHPVSSLDEVKRLYVQHDNPGAAENIVDRISGAYRELGWNPTSNIVRNGPVASAMRLLSPGVDIYKAIAEWLPELQFVDALEPPKATCPAPYLAAILATRRVYGDRCITFWEAYKHNQGNCIKGRRDGVEALRCSWEARTTSGTNTGMNNYMSMAGQAVACCEAYMNGSTYANRVQGKNWNRFARDARDRQPRLI